MLCSQSKAKGKGLIYSHKGAALAVMAQWANSLLLGAGASWPTFISCSKYPIATFYDSNTYIPATILPNLFQPLISTDKENFS